MKEQLIDLHNRMNDIMQELLDLEGDTPAESQLEAFLQDANGCMSDAQHQVDLAIKNINE